MNRALPYLLIAVLLAACIVPAPSPAQEAPADYGVYKITSDRHQCSAVAIEPGVALTAKHCGGVTALLLPTGDTLSVHSRKPTPDVDVQVLAVPGLACPCLPLGRYGLVGEVAAIGFPRGEPRITLGRFMGYGFAGPVGSGERVLVHDAPIAGGASGGALVQRGEDGRPWLVGILIGHNDAGSFAVFVGDVPGLVAR